jgi:hypothetical protein
MWERCVNFTIVCRGWLPLLHAADVYCWKHCLVLAVFHALPPVQQLNYASCISMYKYAYMLPTEPVAYMAPYGASF